MKIKFKFILFIAILHAIFLALSVPLLQISPWLFLLSEAVIMGSVTISITIYRQFVKPLDLISAGIESIKDKDFGMKFVKVGQYELDNLIDVYNNMIDQLREERIHQQEQHFFLQKLIESSPSGVIILNLDESIYTINPAAKKMLNFAEEITSEQNLNSIDSELIPELLKLELNNPKIVQLHQRSQFRIQKAAFIDRGFQHYFIQIEELTKEILQAERAAYEKVIRMISHEINNSVGAVNSILQSCISMPALADKTANEVLEVAHRRNSHLLAFMANFGKVFRLPATNKTTVNLSELLKGIQPLLAGSSSINIEWIWQLSKNPLLIELDEHQFEQLIVNVLKNAVEAIENGGKIFIETSNHPIKRLSIKNSGQQIPAEFEQKIFSPFFTSKENGQGIGLTLAQEILRNHGLRFGLHNIADGLVEFFVEFE